MPFAHSVFFMTTNQLVSGCFNKIVELPHMLKEFGPGKEDLFAERTVLVFPGSAYSVICRGGGGPTFRGRVLLRSL